jgi:hypothetical protein
MLKLQMGHLQPSHDIVTRMGQSQIQIYFTTGGLPAISSSWCKAPWKLRPEILTVKTLLQEGTKGMKP